MQCMSYGYSFPIVYLTKWLRQSHPLSLVFRKLYATLHDGIQVDLTPFAVKLYSAELISLEIRNKATQVSAASGDRASTLLSAVEIRVKSNESKIWKFLEILEVCREDLAKVGKNMRNLKKNLMVYQKIPTCLCRLNQHKKERKLCLDMCPVSLCPMALLLRGSALHNQTLACTEISQSKYPFVKLVQRLLSFSLAWQQHSTLLCRMDYTQLLRPWFDSHILLRDWTEPTDWSNLTDCSLN